MVRKLAFAVLMTSLTGIASATASRDVSCTTHYFWGIIPYEVCTVDHQTKPVAAPEIDAASAVAGLTLMIGGLAVLRGRRNKIANS